MRVKTVIDIDMGDKYFEYLIEGYIEPYVEAKLSGHPDTWAPSEGGYAEIENVFLQTENGKLIPIDTKKFLKIYMKYNDCQDLKDAEERVELEMLKYTEDEYILGYDDYCENRYDSLYERD